MPFKVPPTGPPIELPAIVANDDRLVDGLYTDKDLVDYLKKIPAIRDDLVTTGKIALDLDID